MWSVILEPAEAPDEESGTYAWAPRGGGLVVLLTDGKIKSLVGRVAYSRWRSTRPWVTFKRSLKGVILRAEFEAVRLNAGVKVRERTEA